MKVVQNPADIGFSAEAMAGVRGIIQDAVGRDEVLGVALQVSRNGAALPVACFGKRTLEGAPIEEDTIFLVASISKPIVCAAVLHMVEQGRVCLDDRVVQYVPEFGANGKEEVTVRHLLTHTSGLPDMIPENHEYRAAHRPLGDFVARVCELELIFQPGTRVSYQSMGIAMLGAIVERLAGRGLPEVMEQVLFAPLELLDTSLGRQEDRREREAEIRLPQMSDAGGPDSDWHWNSDYWRNFAAPWGGMLTTAGELTMLCRVFLEGGEVDGTRVLSRAAVAAMTRDQTAAMADLPAGEKLRQCWGLGWKIGGGDLVSRRAFGHGGATGAEVWADPESGVTCVLLTNDPGGAGALRPRVGNAVAAAVL